MKWPDSTNRQLFSGGDRGLRVTVIKLTFHHPGRPGDCHIINNNNDNNNNNFRFTFSNFLSVSSGEFKHH